VNITDNRDALELARDVIKLPRSDSNGDELRVVVAIRLAHAIPHSSRRSRHHDHVSSSLPFCRVSLRPERAVDERMELFDVRVPTSGVVGGSPAAQFVDEHRIESAVTCVAFPDLTGRLSIANTRPARTPISRSKRSLATALDSPEPDL